MSVGAGEKGDSSTVTTRRPGVGLLGALEAVGGRGAVGGLETVGAEDAGLCVDGVCTIPPGARDGGAEASALPHVSERPLSE